MGVHLLDSAETIRYPSDIHGRVDRNMDWLYWSLTVPFCVTYVDSFVEDTEDKSRHDSFWVDENLGDECIGLVTERNDSNEHTAVTEGTLST